MLNLEITCNSELLNDSFSSYTILSLKELEPTFLYIDKVLCYCTNRMGMK